MTNAVTTASLSADAQAITEDLARYGLDLAWLAAEAQWGRGYVEQVMSGALPGCPVFFARCRRVLGMTAAGSVRTSETVNSAK